MSVLFVSHSSRDGDAAQRLARRLEDQGHRSVFLDLDPEKGILAGASWERTLYTKLRSARAVVALCTDNYLASHWCFAEAALARMEGKLLFALRAEPWSEATRMPSILQEGQFIDLIADPEDGYRRLWTGLEAVGIRPAEHRVWEPGESPYPGLRAFEERDAPIFFGRAREIQEGVELLQKVRRQGQPRFVLILGSSGSGKSSLARAGIVPRLRGSSTRAGDWKRYREWLVVEPFRPGADPIRSLAGALGRTFERLGQTVERGDLERRLEGSAKDAELDGPSPGPRSEDRSSEPEPLLAALEAFERDLKPDEKDLAAALAALRLEVARRAETRSARRGNRPKNGAPSSPESRAEQPLIELADNLRRHAGAPEASVVLVVDQWEELLGRASRGPEGAASRFLRLLRAAIEAEDSPLLVLATMRSDYLETFQRDSELRGLAFRSLSVGPMTRDGMRRIILEPAQLGQIELEAGLAERLLDDTETGDALPLLAFTLRAMWNRYHGDRVFRFSEYEELGGLQGAVAQAADDTLEAALNDGKEATLRDAFLSLARPTEDGAGWARRPVAWDELSADARPMLQRFVDQRLLVRREGGLVEVAHEALFRSWGVLRGWLHANREGLELRRDIQAVAEKWQAAGGDEERESLLWRGARLARARELAERGVLRLEEQARGFIEASRRAEVRQRELEEERRRRELAQAKALAEEQRRSARRFRAGLIAAMVLALLAGGAAWFARSKQAESLSEKLASASIRVAPEDQQLSLLLALEAARRAPTAAAERALRGALAHPGQVLARFGGHEADVIEVAWSPDGRAVASASFDDDAGIWELSSGKGVTLSGHEGRVLHLAWNPAGDRLATAGIDLTTRIWSASGDELVVLRGHEAPLAHVAWDATGRRLATAADDSSARIWDAESGEQLALLEGHTDFVKFANWHGRRVVTASFDQTARIWDAETGREQLALRGHFNRVRQAKFSHEGSRVATASDDRTARIWDAGSGRQVHLLTEHEDQVVRVGWSLDDRVLLTASRNGVVRFWNAEDGSLATSVDLEAELVDAEWGPPNPEGGLTVLAASRSGEIHVWELSKGGSDATRVAVLGGGHQGILDADWSSAGLIASGGPGGSVLASSPHAGSEIGALRLGDSIAWSASWSPDGDRIVTTGEEGRITVWDAATKSLVHDLEGAESDVMSAGWSSRSERLAAAGRGGAWIWNAGSGELLARLEDAGSGFVTAAVGARNLFAAAGFDRAIHVLSLDSGMRPVRLVGHRSMVRSVSWDEAGAKLVSAGVDGTVRIWQPELRPEPLQVLRGHGTTVWHAAFSPDGTRVASASADRSARVWDVASGQELVAPLRGRDWLNHVSWSHDGNRLAVAGRSGQGWIWTPGGRPTELVGHNGLVSQIAWSPDDRRVLTAGEDGTARIWDARDGREIAVLSGHRGRVREVSWSPDGRYFLTAGFDGQVRIHAARFADLPALGCERAVRMLTQAEWQLFVGRGSPRDSCSGKRLEVAP